MIAVRIVLTVLLLAGAAARAEPAAVMVESGTARLFTLVYPRPDAETVMLLHGGPGAPMDFAPLAERLAGRYQVIVFEQRGTGRSPAPGATYTMDEYLADIDAVARRFDLQSFHLFGQSWGGLYAQLYAQNNPQRVRSLFLSSPSPGTGEQWKAAEREVMEFNGKRTGAWGGLMMRVKSVFGMLGFDWGYQSLFKQVLEIYGREFAPSFTATDAMVENVRAAPINETRPHILEYPPLADGVDYPFPVLIGYGRKDIYQESREYVRRRFPKARFVEFEHAGHLAWRDAPAEFNAVLADFYGLR